MLDRRAIGMAAGCRLDIAVARDVFGIAAHEGPRGFLRSMYALSPYPPIRHFATLNRRARRFAAAATASSVLFAPLALSQPVRAPAGGPDDSYAALR